ncbi:hypothetical protein BH10PSE17_BH10PSE17_23530 [soil metagenome]
MATDQSFVDYIVAQVSLGAALSTRKMFGEYAIYVNGKVVAFASDNQLFVKPTAAGRALLERIDEQPPYPGGKPWLLIDELLDDAAALRLLFTTTADALPTPKPKAAKKVAKPATAKKR